MDISIEIVDESEMGPELDSRVRELLCTIFPDWSNIFEERRVWHSKPPIYSVVARDGQDVVGHIAVVVRAITTSWNFRYNVASIQGVCVDPEYRSCGLAKLMLTLVLAEARNRGFLYALLYCKESLVPFYHHQGWRLADDNVVMWNQQDLPISMRSNCPMFYELGDIPFPEGPLDVHSPGW